MKKVISLFCVLAMLLATMGVGGISFASADTYGDYTYTVSDGAATITKYTGSATTLSIPSTLGGYPVKTIGNSAFDYSDSVTSLTIPSSVTAIESYAFYDCDGLTSVTVPGTVATVGKYVFAQCDSLKTVTVSSGVKSLDNAVFSYCPSLSKVTLPASLTTLGTYVFSHCTALTSLTIPSGVTSIGLGITSGCNALSSLTVNGANTVYHSANNGVIHTADKELVAGCKATVIPTNGSVTEIGYAAFDSIETLTKITIPSAITVIADSAFEYCTGLTSVVIPSSVKKIQGMAFYHCESLASVTLNSGLERISIYAFAYCYALKSISIPASVTYISDEAFTHCRSMTSMTVNGANTKYRSSGNCIIDKECKELIAGCKASVIPTDGSVTVIGSYAFEGIDTLTAITIPNKITEIKTGAFYKCSGLKSITIPNSVKTMGSMVFANDTALASVTLPSGLTEIADYMFQSCEALTSVTIPSGVTTISERAFTYCSKLKSVTIPASVNLVEQYAFYYCESLANVYYGGNASQWNTITIEQHNGYLTGATRHYTNPTVVKYTISYNANGGSGAPAAQTKTEGTALTLSSTKPTRTNYTFLGWSTSASATTASYQPGAQFKTNANTVLYAVWKLNEYKVSYNGNGGSGVPAVQTKKHGTALKLSNTIPTRSGYGFVGWATSSTATKASYQPGTQYTGNSNVTFYAVWQKDAYRVTFVGNGGSGVPNVQMKVKGTPLKLASQIPTRSGYAFVGWSTSSSAATASYQPGGQYKNNATTTLYAVWKKDAYRITFAGNGGSGVPNAQIKVKGTALKLSTQMPTRSGYAFLGWSTSSSATTPAYQPGAQFKTNATTTLYAVWKKDAYRITFAGNGGSGVPNYQIKVKGTALKLSTQIPTRSGYAFVGWSTSSTATTASYQPGGQFKNNATTTLYAVWKKDAYRVTFAGNGGSGVPNAQIKVKGTALKLSTQIPTRSGYAFVGWSTNSAATTATYQPGGQFKNNATTTLYAVWKKA